MDAIADPLRRRAIALAARLRAGSAVGSDPADAPPALHSVVRTTRAAAFWAGIALPFVHFPLLLVAGLSPATTPLLLALWTLHALSLVVGAGHEPGGPDARRDGGESASPQAAPAVADD